MANSTLLNTVKMAMLVLVLFTINGVQANIQVKGVEACRTLENDTARLACYDTLFGSVIGKPAAAEVSTNAVDKAMNKDLPHKSTETGIAKTEVSLPKTKPPTPPLVTAVAIPLAKNPLAKKPLVKKPIAKVTQSAEASFGAEQLVNDDPAKVVSTIQATVVEIKESVRGLRTFMLDNGQHWKESETNRLRIKEGQLVTLKKGALSAYHLSKADSGRTMRVKRVK